MPDGYISNGCTDVLGYKVYHLRNKKILKRERIHRLVAKAFIPNPENKPQVNHIDSNRINNHFSNLEWVTNSENLHHAIRVGRMNNRGSNHGMSKLTESQVREMRRIRNEEKLTHQKIADIFGIDRRQCGDIINGKNWGWLT